MDMEERILSHRIEIFIELLIVLVLKVRRHTCPERLNLVDHLVLVCVDILSIFPLLLLAEDHRNRHELAILVKKALDAALLSELLLVLRDIKSDDSSSVSLVALLHIVFRRSVASPLYSLRTVLP